MSDYNASIANITGRIASIQSRFGARPPASSALTSPSDAIRSDASSTDSGGSSFGTLVDRMIAQTTQGTASTTSSALNDLIAASLEQQSGLAGTLEPNRPATITLNPAVTEVQNSAARSTTGAADGNEIVRLATQYLGIPYVWGGEDPSGFDCSGLVQHVFDQAGLSLPRVARDQAKVGAAVASLDQAVPGDLIAFGDPVDHIGIYAGDGKMVVAPHTGDVVKIQDITRTPTAIRRIIAPSTAPAPVAFPSTDAVSATGAGTAAAIETPISLVAAEVTAPVPSVVSAAASTTNVQSTDTGSEAVADPGANFRSMFQQAGVKYGVSPTLLEAVAKQESQFNPNAQSPAGAQGLMQMMPSTARALKIDPYEPSQAIDGAARLLSQHLRQFGSVSLALAAYNAGPGAVQKFGGVPPYRETQGYVSKIMTDLTGRLGLTNASTVSTVAAYAQPNSTTAVSTGAVSTGASAASKSAVGSPIGPVVPQAPTTTRVNDFASAATVAAITNQTTTAAASTTAATTAATTATTPATTGAVTKPTASTATAVPQIIWPTGTPVGPASGAWGPNTQTQVRSVGGENTVSWGEGGLLVAASPEDVQKYAPTATGPVAKGVIKSLQNATAIQMQSREFRQTLNDVNRDALGLPDAPDVIPVDPPAPANATAAAAAPAATTTADKPLATVLTGTAAVPPTATTVPVTTIPSTSPKSV